MNHECQIHTNARQQRSYEQRDYLNLKYRWPNNEHQKAALARDGEFLLQDVLQIFLTCGNDFFMGND